MASLTTLTTLLVLPRITTRPRLRQCSCTHENVSALILVYYAHAAKSSTSQSSGRGKNHDHSSLHVTRRRLPLPSLYIFEVRKTGPSSRILTTRQWRQWSLLQLARHRQIHDLSTRRLCHTRRGARNATAGIQEASSTSAAIRPSISLHKRGCWRACGRIVHIEQPPHRPQHAVCDYVAFCSCHFLFHAGNMPSHMRMITVRERQTANCHGRISARASHAVQLSERDGCGSCIGPVARPHPARYASNQHPLIVGKSTPSLLRTQHVCPSYTAEGARAKLCKEYDISITRHSVPQHSRVCISSRLPYVCSACTVTDRTPDIDMLWN